MSDAEFYELLEIRANELLDEYRAYRAKSPGRPEFKVFRDWIIQRLAALQLAQEQAQQIAEGQHNALVRLGAYG